MERVILEAEGVSYRYPGARDDAVRGVSLRLSAGEVMFLVGPNGSGKTTLLRLMLGLLRPAGGEARVMGVPVQRWKRRALARLVGVVAQREEPVFPVTVRQLVMLGRYPHLGPLGAPRAEDRAAVERAMALCDVLHLADRWVATLSGGEWQRVRIARALAQEPRALLLDEPTANLDIRHEMEVFELVCGLAGSEGVAVLVVSHHVNLAARYGQRIAVLQEGRIRALGPPLEVLRRQVLEAVFGWPIEVVNWRGVPQLVPLKNNEVDPISREERER
ncbi:MAG: ABC transporter ATP-binding protein [Gemmatimonadales bacterium]|nr:Iron(3+)-hydroxamate import ATP-binding protein FhuC [bacterium HR33]GIW51256.1 MAG: ABC transporter ATP-binding protein [Gemmatimonadales bacterium]